MLFKLGPRIIVICSFYTRIVAFFVVDAEGDFKFSVELVPDFFELLVGRCKVKLFGVFLLFLDLLISGTDH